MTDVRDQVKNMRAGVRADHASFFNILDAAVLKMLRSEAPNAVIGEHTRAFNNTSISMTRTFQCQTTEEREKLTAALREIEGDPRLLALIRES